MMHGQQNIESHKDSEGGWNVGFPSLLWHSAQLGWQSSSAWCAGHILPSRKSFGANFCNRLSRSKGHWMQSEWLRYLKISMGPTRIWAQKILSLAQTTVPSLTPENIYVNGITHWVIHLGVDKSIALYEAVKIPCSVGVSASARAWVLKVYYAKITECSESQHCMHYGNPSSSIHTV
jgi:hypothetical protein